MLNKITPLKIFFILWIISGIISGLTGSASFESLGGDMARFATAESIVEHGTFAIDDSFGLATVDKVYVNGHFYGCQMPLLSMIMAGVYFLIHNIGLSFKQNALTVRWLLVWIFSGTAAAGITAILTLIFYRERKNMQSAALFGLIFFFCTLYFPQSTFLSHHIIAGFLIISAYYLIVYRSENNNILILAGFLSGIAAMVDPPPGAAFTAAFAVYIIYKKRKILPALWFGLAAIPPLIVHSWANINIHGSIFPVNVVPEYFKYYGAVFDESNLSGVVINDSLKEIVTYGFGLFFGQRGLFPYTPLLLFAVYGLYKTIKGGVHRDKALVVLIPILFISAFYIWRTQNYGGGSYGIRFFLPFVPVLYVMTIFIWDLFDKKIYKTLFIAAAGISFIVAVIGLYKPISSPYLGINTFASNIFQWQTRFAKKLNPATWRLLAFLSWNDPEVIAYSAEQMMQFEDTEQAEKAFKRSLDIEENYIALNGMGDAALLSAGKIDAIPYYRRSLELNYDPQIYSKMGEAFFLNSEYDSCKYYIDKYLLIGDSLNSVIPEKLTEHGLGYFGKAGKTKTLAILCENYMAQGELDSAKDILDGFPTPERKTHQALKAYAKYYLLTGDTARAVENLTAALRKRPVNYKVYLKDEILSKIARQAMQNIKARR